MIKNRLAKYLFAGTFAATVVAPAIALAQEGAAAGGGTAAARPWQENAARAMAAALAVGLAALGAGYAQAKIGSAGAGTLAERPEERIWVIVLEALPEVIVLLGFVSAILINGG